jgi:small subunit ribosomal protein S17
MPRRILVGVVTSDKASKTRRVEIERLVRHPRYSKIIRKKTVCHAHDEYIVSRVGDRVEIEESRPLSKLKRWNLVKVVEKNKQVEATVLGDEAASS